MPELLSLVSLGLAAFAVILSLAALSKASKAAKGGGSVKSGPSHAEILADAGRAELSVALVKHPSVTDLGKVSQDFRIWITNDSSRVPAFNVNIQLDLPEPVLFKKEVDEKLPCRELAPGKSLELCTRISLSTPKQFVARVVWQNPNGTGESEDYLLDRSTTDN